MTEKKGQSGLMTEEKTNQETITMNDVKSGLKEAEAGRMIDLSTKKRNKTLVTTTNEQDPTIMMITEENLFGETAESEKVDATTKGGTKKDATKEQVRDSILDLIIKTTGSLIEGTKIITTTRGQEKETNIIGQEIESLQDEVNPCVI